MSKKAKIQIIARAVVVSIAALLLTLTAVSATSKEALADPVATAKPDKVRKRFEPKPVTGVVNINTATAVELRKLPGIGPGKAARIIEYRQKQGPFKRLRDLRRVKGIGRKTLEKLTPHLAIQGATTIR